MSKGTSAGGGEDLHFLDAGNRMGMTAGFMVMLFAGSEMGAGQFLHGDAVRGFIALLKFLFLSGEGCMRIISILDRQGWLAGMISRESSVPARRCKGSLA